jgi:branched-chain amino acid transport system substrate-binding protein
VKVRLVIVLWVAFVVTPAQAQSSIRVVTLAELSGAGATSGTHFRNGAELAAKELNAQGGILGRRIDLASYDTQSSPSVAKAMATKAVDDGALAVVGPVFSGSVLVSMAVTREARIPNFMGGEATAITQRGNPFVFRTSFSQASAMPKVARYLADTAKVRSIAIIYINNDFGKGGRDALVQELGPRNIQVAAEVAADQGQIDFSGPVLKVKSSGADVLFAYLNVDESARLLRELRKQGYDKPIIGETTIMQQSVIDLAGDAANGVRGHVGLTIDAPNPRIGAYAEKYEREFGLKSSHDGIKGYTALYLLKAAIEKTGKANRVAVAEALKNVCFSAAAYPGILLDVCYDDKGDIDRESYMVEVKGGKQVVVETLPSMKKPR